MTKPIEDDAAVPLRLHPVVARPEGWRGRSSSLVAVGLVSFVVVGIVLGTLFDDSGPPNQAGVAGANTSTATPNSTSSARPSRGPTPTREPLATPLPTMEILGGQIPTERRLVHANGLQVLDLATGTLIGRPWQDSVLPLGDDQLVCACVVRGVDASGDPTALLRFKRFDLSQAPIIERDLLTFDGAVPVPDMDEGFNLVAALSADRRSLFALVVARVPPVWTVDLHQIDVETGALVSTTVLDELPVDLEEPSRQVPGVSTPNGVYAWASGLAVSPDGGTVFASVQLNEVRNENWTSNLREWMIAVQDGLPGKRTPPSPEARLEPDAWCVSQPIFVDPDLLVQVCVLPEGDPARSNYSVRKVSVSGETFAEIPIPGDTSGGYFTATPVLDRVRRAVLVWEFLRHTLTRVSVDDGQVDEGAVLDPKFERNPADGFGGRFWTDSGLVASPDGRRLYALGFRSGLGLGDVGTTTGIWVFDADTLTLLDHWEPRALLTSLAVSADGRFVYAAGASGLDVDGRENPWPASITVYDSMTGEIQVLYGAIGRDIWLSFPIWP